jgi:NAD(P)-dependent dehydrogenase (short-subunit alcohol dehydrogenase family)
MKRVCLLTGASSLLGRAFLQRYAHQYRIIAVHHRRPVEYATQNQRFVDPLLPDRAIAANDHAVYAVPADLSQREEVERVVHEMISQCGNVDLVINAAAVRCFSPLLKSGTLECADLVFQTNVLAPLLLSTRLAQTVWDNDTDANLARNRNIVNISSTAGLFVYPDLGQALYGTTKAALNHLTYHLASEFWDIGIRVNAIAPNTFPQIVATECVLDAIAAFDAGTETGQVLPLDAPSPGQQATESRGA